MSIEIAQVIVEMFEVYAAVGVVFAVVFLSRGVARVDPRTGAAPKTLRLLIMPGVTAFWPFLAWRWINGTAEPLERNPHRDRAARAIAPPVTR